MNFKNILKHVFILTGIMFIIGVLFSILAPPLPVWKTVSYIRVLLILLVPLIYSLFINNTFREWVTIGATFIVISLLVVIGVVSVLNVTDGSPQLEAHLRSGVMAVPQVSILSTLCIPYIDVGAQINGGSNTPRCPLSTASANLNLLVGSILALIVVIALLVAGHYLYGIRKKYFPAFDKPTLLKEDTEVNTLDESRSSPLYQTKSKKITDGVLGFFGSLILNLVFVIIHIATKFPYGGTYIFYFLVLPLVIFIVALIYFFKRRKFLFYGILIYSILFVIVSIFFGYIILNPFSLSIL